MDSEDGKAVGAERNWTVSVLLLVLWGALMYYVFNHAPNQTPAQDSYLLKKLLHVEDDGLRMNQVLMSLWCIMGLWPLVYSMLLLPTGSRCKIPAWPFLLCSIFGGIYVLLPYFAIRCSPPRRRRVLEAERRGWPLNFMESKLTAGLTLVSGLGLILYAVSLNGDEWTEFYQFFRESRFIHIMSVDFCSLSVFAPFWVYNDMTVRKRCNKGQWLLPVSLVPFLGPSLYLLLRPSLSELKKH